MSFREQLMSALNTAVEHFNGGMPDTDAVIKAASDADFNKDQTQRLVETFNTAKSIYFFKSADDRRGSFPLVDPAVVIDSLFAPEATTKAAAAQIPGDDFELRDYSFYDRPEPYYDGRFDLDKSGAQAFDWEEVKQSAADKTLDGLHFSLTKHARTSRQLAERCRSTADMLEHKYNEALEKVAAYIKKDWAEPDRMADVEHYLWSKFGSQMSEPIVNDLMKWLPGEYQEKRATADQERLPSSFATRCPEVSAHIDEVSSVRFNSCAMEAMAQEFAKEADEMLAEWDKISGIIPPEDPADDMFDPQFLKGAQAPGDSAPKSPKPGKGGKGDGFLGPALESTFKNLGGSVAEGATRPITDAAKAIAGEGAEEEQKLTDKMRNLKRQFILEDFVANDQVLSGEDPALVAQAYQTLVNLAPDVSLEKEVARSVVRASVNAVSMSPFDAKAIAELENELRRQLNVGRKERTA